MAIEFDNVPYGITEYLPKIRITGRLAWLARGVGPMTDDALPDLVGATVIFNDSDGRHIYRLTAWHPAEGYYDAEWPD